ncbi:MAG: phosphoribosylaminoimidazolesuccinocarboxamide synthase [Planctomycetes bacterium]|nr:phosphoribosylaminoimidazolesuccinocarboxamide synthase [Planctomycetota bacterium]
MSTPTSANGAYLGREDAPPGLLQIASGKVRDLYALDGDRLLLVASDRISAFDVVMNAGVADKGRVLTHIAAHWFERTRDLTPNHLLSTRVEEIPGLDPAWQERLRGRVMITRRCVPDPIEWVVRGYITGSGWKEYLQSGTVCGIALPAGLRQAERLPEPIVTPTTKNEAHDRPLSPDEAAELLGAERWEAGKRLALALYARGAEDMARHGILLADTKFEFGTLDGEVVLIDEALTPDSSRFWPEAAYAVGGSPPSLDKQILRDHLETLDWDKEYPAPDLDPAVLDRVRAGYLDVCRTITGSLPEGVS